MIRSYRADDLAFVLDLWAEFDRFHVASDPSRFRIPGDDERLTRHLHYTADAESFLLVADAGSALSGFIAGTFRKTPAVALLRDASIQELHAIFVLPDTRTESVGSELVRAALALGRTRRALEAVCHIWSFNDPAAAMVRKLGFYRQSSKYAFRFSGLEESM